MVTLNHFTTPLWFAKRGGFEVPDAPALFARYCAKVVERLGPLMDKVTTNEANIRLLVDLMPGIQSSIPIVKAAIAAAAKATDSPRFSRLAYADPQVATPIMIEAHRQAYDAIKKARARPARRGDPDHPGHPVGDTIPRWSRSISAGCYGDWVEVARTHADFFGVQTYTRFVVDENGVRAPPKDAELTLSGYEFYPQALANTIRWAHRAIGKPIYVTESGIATNDDARRIAFIDQALDGVRQCLDEGIAVHGYLYWSLLDNFEWTSGYGVPFGLVAVDRKTFKRTPRGSAVHLGRIARAEFDLSFLPVVIPEAPQGRPGPRDWADAVRLPWVPDKRCALSGMTTMGELEAPRTS